MVSRLQYLYNYFRKISFPFKAAGLPLNKQDAVDQVEDSLTVDEMAEEVKEEII